MLVLITGMPGSGKSTLCAELSNRGYSAVDADNGICAWVDRQLGVVLDNPPAFPDRTPEFYELNTWRYQRDQLELLQTAHSQDVCFVVGIADGQRDVHDLFVSRFFLKVVSSELERRLMTRTNGVFAAATSTARIAQVQRVLPAQGAAEEAWLADELEPIDSLQAVDRVADEVLSRCGLPRSVLDR